MLKSKYLKNKLPYLSLIFAFLLIQATSFAQLSNKVENFTLNNVIDKTSFSLSDYKKVNCVVVIFVSSKCAFVKQYEARIADLIKKFQGKAQFIAINPDDDAEEGEETILAQAKVLGIPYLLDDKLKVSHQFEAVKTPEVFVLENQIGDFFVRYYGAIDDNPQDVKLVHKHYLQEAIQMIIDKKIIHHINHKPVGCLIKK